MKSTYEVNPARLEWGTSDLKSEERIGTGDIHASYSGDCICTGQPVRKPFRYQCELWLAVGLSGSGDGSYRATASAYRLLPVKLYKGTMTTYEKKVCSDNGDTARNDPNGFYDGVVVKHGGQRYVMCGPEALFVPGQPQTTEKQLDLF
jgi:hypothetical protein